ncbi:MAG: hypothetical protein QOH25_3132 [Acidobacteriota bacterium]|jgi:hypothetical protein|nr:hypothetical protein [Acidobacteriota bacterium]
MSTGTRLFFLDNDDGIHRISVSKFNRFYLQNDENESFPEFAGQRVRYALVFVKLEGRSPIGVKYVDYGVITFNNEGKLDEEVYRRGRHLAVDMLSIFWPNKENKSVIDASGRFAQKQHQNEFRWKPTPEIEEALGRAIFSIANDEGLKKGKKSSLRLV